MAYFGESKKPSPYTFARPNDGQLETNLKRCWTISHRMEPHAPLTQTRPSISSKSSKETAARKSTGLMCGTGQVNANEPSLNWRS